MPKFGFDNFKEFLEKGPGAFKSDYIMQEDPNASTPPYTPQIDFPVRTEAPPEINKFQDLLQQFKNLSGSAPRTEGNPVAIEMPEPKQEPSAMTPRMSATEESPKIDARQREETTNPRDIDFSYEKLQDLLKNRDSSGLSNVLLRAGMMANQGIARMGGADVKPDEGALQALAKQGDAPLENFTTKMRAYSEIELQDPKSDISNAARTKFIQAMQRTNPGIDVSKFQNLSATQLKQLGAFGDDSLKALNLELQRQRLDLQRDAESGKGERFYDRLDLSKDMFQNKKKEQDRLSSTQEQVLTGFDQTLAGLSDIKKAKPLFDTGPIKDRFERAKKAFGLEDADFAGFKSRIAGNMSAYIKSVSGTAASDLEVERLKEVAPQASDSDESFLKKLAAFEDQVKKSKNTVIKSYQKLDRDVRGYQDDLGKEEQKSKTAATEKKVANEVERLDKKTGKIAIFDADTKQFLRYK